MKANKNVEQEVLPKKVLEICNFTDEEIEMLKDADALVATADRLPDNPDKLIDKIIKEFPDDFGEDETLRIYNSYEVRNFLIL
jgi:hypothetical protein